MLRCTIAVACLACSASGRRFHNVGNRFDASEVATSSKSLARVLLAARRGPARSSLSRNSVAFSSAPVRRKDVYMEVSSTLPKSGGDTEYCGEEMMSKKGHGTSSQPVQKNLRWNVDLGTADRICNFNRHYAEYSGYWTQTRFLKEVDRDKPTVYYDSVSGLPLYVAPIGRSMDEFLAESNRHGWPSFRREEVVWENVRVLKGSGEVVSKTGTHLGHDLPDRDGARHCINLVSIAGQPLDTVDIDTSPADLEPPANPLSKVPFIGSLFR